AGDDRELRALAGFRPAVQEAGAEGAVAAAGREAEPRPRRRRQHREEVALGIRPEPRIRDARDDRCSLIVGGEVGTRRLLRLLGLLRRRLRLALVVGKFGAALRVCLGERGLAALD